MKGINVCYTLDPVYFEIGAAFEIRVGANNFRTMLLVKRTDTEAIFKCFDISGEVMVLKLTIDDLRFRDYWLIKLEPDCKNGVFEKE